MEKTTGLAVPTIHLNGSGKKNLTEQLENAVIALNNALDALQQAAPHGRDYYPQGDDAYNLAARQHRSRIESLHLVQNELKDIWERIVNK